MKILLTDPYFGKFTSDMANWWRKQGHEVKTERYWNPQLANEWADLIWMDTADNNIVSATNPGEALLADNANYKPWSLYDMDLSDKRIIVRPIDIEIWQGHQHAARWSLVDDVIFIANHIREVANIANLPGLTDKTKFHTIPCGVDLSRYKFKKRSPGFDIAIVSEKWNSKGTHLLLQVILKLQQIDPRYKIHWLGQRSDSNWEYAYFDDFVEHHNLNIEFTNILLEGKTVDEFLEDKNFLLHGSVKEGFSYAIAEAMAKGIKVVPHRFFGADDNWPGLTWDSIDQAIDKITSQEYDSISYRQYLIDRGYTLDSMMSKIQEVIDD